MDQRIYLKNIFRILQIIPSVNMLGYTSLVLLLTFSFFNKTSSTDIKGVSTFGHSIKNGQLPSNTEVTTFSHQCSLPPCLITLIHIPSIYPPENQPSNWQQGLVRVYVDGEDKAGLEFSLADLAALGQLATKGNEDPLDGSPYGSSLFGKTAKSGGVYSTVRIPFQSNIRTTIESASGTEGTSQYWFIIRGLEATHVRIGDLVLPPSAKLEIQKTRNNTLKLYELINMVQVPSGRAGTLLLTQLDAIGDGFGFLEACLRAFIDGKADPLFLSSGMEDYFLSASYFDEGMFKTPESGLTYLDSSKSAISAYKTHVRDPIVWRDGIKLVWRNCDTAEGCGSLENCPNQFCEDGNGTRLGNRDGSMPHVIESKDGFEKLSDGSAVYSSNVWIYTWQNEGKVSDKNMPDEELNVK